MFNLLQTSLHDMTAMHLLTQLHNLRTPVTKTAEEHGQTNPSDKCQGGKRAKDCWPVWGICFALGPG